jgi:hypothetical protein
LCNDSWRLEYPEAFVKTLPRLEFSDHHPILIYPFGNNVVNFAWPFKFESAWLLNASYKDMLRTCWKNEVSVLDNLQQVQSTIKDWKFNTVDKVIEEKRRLMARIGGIQARIHHRRANYGLRKLEQRLQSELTEILK